MTFLYASRTFFLESSDSRQNSLAFFFSAATGTVVPTPPNSRFSFSRPKWRKPLLRFRPFPYSSVCNFAGSSTARLLSPWDNILRSCIRCVTDSSLSLLAYRFSFSSPCRCILAKQLMSQLTPFLSFSLILISFFFSARDKLPLKHQLASFWTPLPPSAPSLCAFPAKGDTRHTS